MVRVALLALRNLLAAPGLELGPEMVELGLPKVVQQRMLQVRRPRPCMCVHRVRVWKASDVRPNMPACG